MQTILRWGSAILCILISQTIFAIPSVNDFVRYGDVENVVISPSGKYIAVSKRLDGNEGISVINLETMEATAGRHFGRNEDISRFMWANDERLLIEPAHRAPAFMAYNAPTGEIWGMDADGSSIGVLFGFRARGVETGTIIKRRERSDAYAEIIDLYLKDPDWIVVGAWPASMSYGYSDAYLLNIKTGRKRAAAQGKIRFSEFVTNSEGEVTLNYGYDENNEHVIYHREGANENFELVKKEKFFGGKIVPINHASGDQIYNIFDSSSSKTIGISRWDPSQPDSTQSIFEHPNVDADGVYTIRETKEVYAIKYFDHFPKYYYPDPKHPVAIIHQALSKKFPNSDVAFTSTTADFNTTVVKVSSDKSPAVFYLFNKEKGELAKLFASRPWLSESDMSDMQPIELDARDGVKLRGYVTLPKGVEHKNLPAVVLVHGGPYGVQDKWRFNFEAQLLASRGYAVLQVNYRGSGGMGPDFLNAGIKQWGTGIQDDITDATKWIIGTGIVDPKRVCIYGGSFGGYASLNGVVREPDLYQCAIGYAGIYDLPLLFKSGSIQNYKSGEIYLKAALGENTDELENRSPVYNAEKIKAKIMLAHGKNDNRAPVEHAEKMRNALIKAGNEPEYLVETLEGHGFFGVETRENFYTKILEFLDRNIGGQ
ncbi:S9 family peptidase [Aurantivibrio infirmus]